MRSRLQRNREVRASFKKELLTSLTIEDTTYCGNIIKKNHMLIFSLIYTLLSDKITSKLKNQGRGSCLEH